MEIHIQIKYPRTYVRMFVCMHASNKEDSHNNDNKTTTTTSTSVNKSKHSKQTFGVVAATLVASLKFP